jgi:hypothetical protein
MDKVRRNKMDFVGFNKIAYLRSLHCCITQKIHGTQGQVYVFEKDGKLDLLVGKKKDWLSLENDNHGFCAHVHQHKEQFLTLGVGQHFGEWCGYGIHSGEGLTSKAFVLFNFWQYEEDQLPPGCLLVPVLYSGAFSHAKVEEVMADLKENGSRLVKGFMRPEGIVVKIDDRRYKHVFEEETTSWRNGDEAYAKARDRKRQQEYDAYKHLLQPIRLEKLIGRDEAYSREYPTNLGTIVKDYMADLVDEDQLPADTVGEAKSALSKGLYRFIKAHMQEKRI